MTWAIIAYINRQLQPAAGKNEMREDAHSVVGCAFGRGGNVPYNVLCVGKIRGGILMEKFLSCNLSG